MSWLSRLFQRDVSPKPRITMSEVIAELLSSSTESTSEYSTWVISSIQKRFSQEAIDELTQRLLATEKRSMESSRPLEILRKAIMDAVDASALNSALLECNEDQLAALSDKNEAFSEGALLGVYLDAEFEMMCLRLYSLAKYGDGGSHDWFTVYVGGAQEYGKHMAQIIVADSGKYDGDPKLLAVMHRPFEEGISELRARLLTSPVGAVFPDEAEANQAVER